MAKISLYLVEDQGMVLGALVALLELESDLEVIGKTTSVAQAKQDLVALRPDVLLTDIELPSSSGLELAAWLHACSDLVTQCIILTTFARPGYLRRALDAGVRGYLLKDAPSHQLADAVRKVHRGGRAIAPELALDAWSSEDPLTDREREVLRLAGQGKRTQDIADNLHLSPGTVRNYLSEAIGKLDASNRIEAARIARKNGWL